MKKLYCEKCFRHLCTVDEIWFPGRKIKTIKLKCKCNHINKFHLPERLRIIDDINDALERLHNIDPSCSNSKTGEFLSKGIAFSQNLTKDNEQTILDKSLAWLSEVPLFLREDFLSTPVPKIKWHDSRQNN